MRPSSGGASRILFALADPTPRRFSMPPASSSKKKFSMKSFASPKTRTTPDPEALQRLMEKTEVDGGGGLDAKERLRGRAEAAHGDPLGRARGRARARADTEHRLRFHRLQFRRSPQDAPEVAERRKSLAFAPKTVSAFAKPRFISRSIFTARPQVRLRSRGHALRGDGRRD